MKRSFPLHPFLFASAPVLMLYSHNIREAEMAEVFAPLGGVTGMTILLLLLGRLVLRNLHKGAIVTAAFWLLFFSYGHVFSLVRGAWPGRYMLVGMGMFGLCAALGLAVLLLVWRTGKSLVGLNKFLNVIAVAVTIVPIVTVAAYHLRTSRNRQAASTAELAAVDTVSTRMPQPCPDIYFIVLDRHANTRVLQEIYGHDNSGFRDGLRRRGFYVADAATSNYARTHLSLTSTLNLDYINAVTRLVPWEFHQHLLRHRLEDNLVMRFLLSKGYRFLHFGTGWGPTGRNRYADRNANSGVLTDFAMMLYRTTLAYPVGSRLGFDVRTEQYRRVRTKFEQLADVPGSTEPVFVFAHFVLPHEPYVFSPEGEFVSRSLQNQLGVEQGYLNQLMYADRRLTDLVDAILANSDTPPVIILQADEGPHAGDCFAPVDSLTDLRAKFGILNALHIPGADTAQFYPSMTSVNTFRIVLNTYFGTRLPMLPDRGYILDHERYEFVDVTEQVR